MKQPRAVRPRWVLEVNNTSAKVKSLWYAG